MAWKAFGGRAAPEQFAQEVRKHVGHWERFGGTVEEKVRMVSEDPQWSRLLAWELELEPVSNSCREIRKQIACLEACHEHYTDNVKDILAMVGAMKPGRIIDCCWACDDRYAQAAAYAQALETWQEARSLPADADERTREVFHVLGERTKEKERLVQHVRGKLRDNAYTVYGDGEEDFARTEARIQHLAICNHNWKANLRIVLEEIAAGRQLFPWHTPDGFNAHGDCPDRTAELQEVMASVSAWAEGNVQKAGEWGRMLGKPTPEKRWLVASLCKHVSAQHEKHGGERLLAQPALEKCW
jgi:hypothetical protein